MRSDLLRCFSETSQPIPKSVRPNPHLLRPVDARLAGLAIEGSVFLSSSSTQCGSSRDSGEMGRRSQRIRSDPVSKPESPGIHFRLGRLFSSKQPQTSGSGREGTAEFEAELKVNPITRAPSSCSAKLPRRKEKFDDAIAHFSRAVEYDAGNADAHLGLGRLIYGAKRFKGSDLHRLNRGSARIRQSRDPLPTRYRLCSGRPESRFGARSFVCIRKCSPATGSARIHIQGRSRIFEPATADLVPGTERYRSGVCFPPKPRQRYVHHW